MKDIIFKNLQAALDVGYEELRTMSSADIAGYMIAYASNCEGFTTDQIILSSTSFSTVARHRRPLLP